LTKKAEAATRKLEFSSMRRKLFAREYVRAGNQLQAAIAAGYAPGSADVQGSRLMKRPGVVAEVQRLEALRDAEEKIDRMYVLKGLYDMAEEADKDSDKIRALELLGKSLGMFVDQVETHTTHDVSELQEFSLEQLRATYQELSAKNGAKVLNPAEEPHDN
jgi:phage terminase small subunit